LALAKDAGLEMGALGGLHVDASLRTSDPSIFAAGDMVEVEHAILGKRVRMPLAGPANRQGRVVGENALGGSRLFKGVSGSSIVKVFEAVTGSTGLSLKGAKDAGFAADAVVVHKASHTSYFPGSEKVSLMLIWDRTSKKVLGAQVAGRVGVDKRIDVIATAIAGGLTIEDLAELDLAYAPPFNSPNGPVNMAAFTAENHHSGFSPSVLAQDVESFVLDKQPIVLDLRDPLSFAKASLEGSNNLSQSSIRENLDRIPHDHPLLLISDDGQKAHVTLRMLKGSGFDQVYTVSGGYLSLERHARSIGYQYLNVGLFPVEHKSVHEPSVTADISEVCDGGPDNLAKDGPIILDVRTPMEFSMGACPGAINVELDTLGPWSQSIEDHSRKIILYCASGARSSYGVRILKQLGFTNVENGGGLHEMMASKYVS